MIGYLGGKIINKSSNSATILVGGVGYEVFLPTNVLSDLKNDIETNFFIHTHVREDAITLFGFEDKESLEFFRKLLSVSGIGPKVALAIISSGSIDKLKDSISKGDPALLSAVSGVGKKTAEKAVVELKGKLGFAGESSIFVSDETEEIISALLGLGFQRSEIIEGVKKIPNDIEKSDDKIKYLIKNLGRN